MPKRPANPYLLFLKDMKDSGKGLDKAASLKAWGDLGSEGQQKYVQQCRAATAAYQEEVKVWRETREGKKPVQPEKEPQVSTEEKPGATPVKAEGPGATPVKAEKPSAK
eukprot:CAMPEP_0171245408 /NCGR_PEP_ID=MMETSP0790-20130122/47404_1 /TAXON_ID=2925 /ORGANISM="Alexandrium catenella, Strain OF101" /LENGTH=108 /DNA_ID=CAMNT_0011712665 /DNA_START=1 /DNA_END=324 /DNA_ORIENTATION=+